MASNINKIKVHEQYHSTKPPFPAFSDARVREQTLGSDRGRQRKESAYIRSTNFKKEQAGWELGPQDASFPTIITGLGAPTSTPKKRGNTYIDQNSGKVYVSTGIINSSDWKILN